MKNLTAHSVVVLVEGEEVARWEPTGHVARLREVVSPAQKLSGDDLGQVAIFDVAYADDVIDLPDPEEGVGLIVSRVLAADVARPELFFPYPEMRDESGQIIGCGGLARFIAAEAPR